MLAEHAGEKAPDSMQRLFSTARWDEDLVRDDVCGYVTAALGDPDGVLIGDDTGFEKKGPCSAGVQRQYTGTVGKITNCRLSVFLAYAGPRGRALIDRELYCPAPGPGTSPGQYGCGLITNFLGRFRSSIFGVTARSNHSKFFARRITSPCYWFTCP